MTWASVAPGTPRGKGGKPHVSKGRKKIAPGVMAAVQAEALAAPLDAHGKIISGGSAAIATRWGVSTDLVERLAKVVRGLNPEAVTAVRRGLPDMFTVAAGAALEKSIQATEDDDAGTASKWAFTAKLHTESNRWATPSAGSGSTLSDFIRALNEAGGGSLTVAGGPAEAETVADVTEPEPGRE